MSVSSVTMYRTSDGHTFGSEREAAVYDKDLATVHALLRDYLGDKRPESNGTQYVQHTRARVEALRSVYERRGMHPRADDDGGSPWYKVWWHLACIDSRYRGWGQPYFANNPNEKAVAI